MKIKTIAILVLVAILLIIFFQNMQVVEFRLLFWEISMSRIILFPLILITGVLIGYVLAKLLKKKDKNI